MSGKLIFSLDVGSSKVISLVGSLGNKVNIVGMSRYHFVNASKNNDFTMMSNGLICDIERSSIRISQVLHEAQINADCSIGSVVANISGNHVRSVHSSSHQEMGSIPVNEEVIRLMLDESRKRELPLGYEVLDYEIQEYLIDSDRYAINPLDLSCNSIEANVNLFVCGKTPIANLRKTIYGSGFDLLKIIPAPILSGMAVLNRDEKELGCCLIDIGAGTTDVVVYESGFIRYLISIPLGGEDITRDIASVLKISRNLAEDLKLTHGYCGVHHEKHKNEGINIVDHRGDSVLISRKLLNEVISERIRDILEVVKNQLNNNNLCDIISSGIIITGGCALLGNIKEFAGKIFDAPVRIGAPDYVGELSDIVCDPRFSTAVGALYFANEYLLDYKSTYKSEADIEFGSVVNKIKNFFKNM